jgi:hypothetical protein
MACEAVQLELDALVAERTGYQDDLRSASPSQKPFLVAQIRALNRQIAAKRRELNQCLIDNGVPVAMSTSFVGTATLRTSDTRAPGPFTQAVTIGVFFNAARNGLSFSVPTIATDPFDVPTPFGRRTNVTTVSQRSGGSGTWDQASGGASVPLTLLFDHSVDFQFFDEDSTLSLVLHTGTTAGGLTGAPLDRTTRRLRLVGQGTFVDGILENSIGTLEIDGTLAALP